MLLLDEVKEMYLIKIIHLTSLELLVQNQNFFSQNEYFVYCVLISPVEF